MQATKSWLLALLLMVFFTPVTVQAMGSNGVSEKRVRAIVKEEFAKFPRIQGPRGRPGKDGRTFLSAIVGTDGVLFEGTGVGIANENVQRVDTLITLENGEQFIETKYCFSGLPPVTTGQVTPMGVRRPIITTGYLVVETEETRLPGCDITVYIVGQSGFEAANFHLTLYPRTTT